VIDNHRAGGTRPFSCSGSSFIAVVIAFVASYMLHVLLQFK